jgi:hypothetical protein
VVSGFVFFTFVPGDNAHHCKKVECPETDKQGRHRRYPATPNCITMDSSKQKREGERERGREKEKEMHTFKTATTNQKSQTENTKRNLYQ